MIRHHTFIRSSSLALAFSGTLACSAPAWAQAVPNAPGVADVSLVQGNVTIVRGDSGDQVAAAINTPLLPGDYISTAVGSRAEVQLDGISLLRLASNTQLRVVGLNPSAREVQLASGTAELAELRGADGNPQIDTPSVTVRPNGTGDYRVTVDASGQTFVTVRSGSATVASGSGTQTLTTGTTLVADGAYQNPSISEQPAIAFDGFDTFNANRDRTEVAALNATPYLSPQLAGYTNFNQYGQWQDVPGYGESWAPYDQNNGWTPYSDGQWVWEPGYGYTWVGNEPWGYAPYHYGNWYYATSYNQWMWEPPAYQEQSNADALAASWLPALVGFFLTGGNPAAYAGGYAPGAPYGYADVGWVPLAPGEPYQPWYSGFGANAAYPPTSLQSVTNIVNVYRNIRYVHVVHVVAVNRFRNGRFAHPMTVPVSRIAHAAVIRGALPFVPTRALLRPSSRPVHPVTLSPRFRSTRFASQAPVLRAASFQRDAAAIQHIASLKPRIVRAQTHPVSHTVRVYRAPVRRARIAAPIQHRTVTPVTPRQRPVPVVPRVHPAPVTLRQRPVPVVPHVHPAPVTPRQRPVPVVPRQRPVPVVPRQRPVPVVPRQRPVPAPRQQSAPPARRARPQRTRPQRTSPPMR